MQKIIQLQAYDGELGMEILLEFGRMDGFHCNQEVIYGSPCSHLPTDAIVDSLISVGSWNLFSYLLKLNKFYKGRAPPTVTSMTQNLFPDRFMYFDRRNSTLKSLYRLRCFFFWRLLRYILPTRENLQGRHVLNILFVLYLVMR